VAIATDILAALDAIHTHGIVHRDLKPSNVYLTRHGVKLLDFGLARTEPTLDTAVGLTRSGIAMGTPRYMAPEMITGDTVDERSDLFAVGAILFEMLAGRPAFNGRTVAETLNATLTEQPPALTGSPAVAAVDRVIRRALAKKAAERPGSAKAMADELTAVQRIEGHDSPATAQTLTRVVVLPFRVLRPDPDIDFPGLQPARRHHHVSCRHRPADRSIECNGGAICRRRTRHQGTGRRSRRRSRGDGHASSIGRPVARDDPARRSARRNASDLAHRCSRRSAICSGCRTTSRGSSSRGFALPLAGERRSPAPDAPRNPTAYELYLRANGLARMYGEWPNARALYERCVELDPSFAPAWARLGRCHRVIGKYLDPTPDSDAKAEDAFKKAIALNPRLSVAHKFYANLEADTGRAREAIVRLLGEATRHGNDPELFAGTRARVPLFGPVRGIARRACRGETARPEHRHQFPADDADEARHRAAHRCRVHRARARRRSRDPSALDWASQAASTQARQELDAMGQEPRLQLFQNWKAHLEAWARSTDRGDGLDTCRVRVVENLRRSGGHLSGGMAVLRRRGPRARPRLPAEGRWPGDTSSPRRWLHSPQFDALREVPAFQTLLADAEAGRQRALAAFRRPAASGFSRADPATLRKPSVREIV
jgi:tetratricopeptide (TPR) repeat protein